MKKLLLILLIIFLITVRQSVFAQKKAQIVYAQPSISYTLSMEKPQTHFFEVEMRINNLSDPVFQSQGFVEVKMPVWAPGSYLIREFPKNVEGFQAFLKDSIAITYSKVNKNTWRIPLNKHDYSVKIKYRVYAYELSVRTSFLDDSHGYLNGSSIFMYVNGAKDASSTLKIIPHSSFNTISTGLTRSAQASNTFEAVNYDVLVDSPIEIGNQKIHTFTANGVPHTVAMYGETDYSETRLLTSLQKVCETAKLVVGQYPCNDYTFIVHNNTVGTGGLEHANSTTLNVSRKTYSTEAGWTSFLTLAAHEYFHLWNIKRIRPKALGPFDYDNENYTHLLWVAEGLTTYYQTHIVQRAGLITPEQYLNAVARDIATIENNAGQRVQSVAESSWDAWIKYYRPNENSKNSTVSYYDKGAVLGAVLDLYILRHTLGAKNLDDVMKNLYDEFYLKKGRGFTDEELQKAFEMVSGDYMTPFFQKYIFGTEPIPYNEYLQHVGCKLIETQPNLNEAYLGADTKITDGKVLITFISRDSPAWETGLNVNDEIVMIDGLRIQAQADVFAKTIQAKKVGSVVKLIVVRDGLMKEIEAKLVSNPIKAFKVERLSDATPEQQELFGKWLRR